MTTNETHIFCTPNSKRIAMALAVAGGVSAGVLASGAISLPALVGAALGGFWATKQTCTVTANKISVKSIIGKPKEFLFSEGTFTIEHQTGVKAFMTALSTKACLLSYTPHATGKSKRISITLSAEDVEKVYELIQQ